MGKSLALSTLVLLSGCTALETREAQGWLALHAIDTLQTYHAAQMPNCYMEGDSITRSIIGAHPSDSSVIAWSLAMSGLHLGVTELLLSSDHPKLAKVWQYMRIGVTTSAIAQNHSVGIRIGSPNRPSPGECITVAPAHDDNSGARPIR